MITPYEMDAYWRSTYPDCEPIPYWLREVYPHRWVRFHSLPDSKRYADDSSETQIILDRHNAILGDLALPNEALVLLSTGYTDTPIPCQSEAALTPLDSTAQHWRTIAKHKLENDEEYPNYWHLYMSVWAWRPGIFNPILRLVAADRVANTMIVSTTHDWIYHPYDGGADVILNSSEARDRLKFNFQTWLSPRDDGL